MAFAERLRVLRGNSGMTQWQIAQALNISLDTPVYYICRRVLADNTPVLFSTDIVPCSLFGTTRTDGIDFTRPIFDILDEACGIQVSSTITHLRAAMGDPPCAMPWPCSVIRPCWN